MSKHPVRLFSTLIQTVVVAVTKADAGLILGVPAWALASEV